MTPAQLDDARAVLDWVFHEGRSVEVNRKVRTITSPSGDAIVRVTVEAVMPREAPPLLCYLPRRYAVDVEPWRARPIEPAEANPAIVLGGADA